MDFIPPHQAQDLAAPGDGAQPGEWRGRVWLGRGEEGPLDVAEPEVVGVDQREVHLHALLDGRSRNAFGHAVPVRLVGELLVDVGSVILAIRLLDRGQPLRSRAHLRHPAPPEVPRGAPVSRIDVGLGERAAAEQHRHLRRVDGIVFGLAPVDGLQIEPVAQDARKTLAGAEVSQPCPR
jgi:hypothetical protein